MPDTNFSRTAVIAGIVLGLLVWISTAGSVGWIAGLLLGVIAAVLLAAILVWLGQGSPSEDGTAWEPQAVAAPVQPVAQPVAKQPEPAPAPTEKAAVSPKAEPAKQVKAKAVVADDLKEIKGVGPKLEEVLHQHGVTTFAQIAAWSDAEVDHFAELLGRLGGRIRSEEWVEQAKALSGKVDAS